MSLNVKAELAELAKQPLPQLKKRYESLYGETARPNHRAHLIKRILWRLQANEQGDLPERARRRAEELARDVDIRVRPPRGYIESEAASLPEVVGILNGTLEAEPHPPVDVASLIAGSDAEVDFVEVRGQEAVKRAIVVAASGSHNLLQNGPSGGRRGPQLISNRHF